MATLVLAAAGSALGGALGGSVAGLTSLALGKAAGAALGSIVDQRLLGAGAEPVETGKVDRFRVMGSSEGAVLPRVFGRMRIAGQIIWSSRFLESSNTQNVGGKGGGQKVREFSYSISLAVALCEGEVSRIGRIWADGIPLDQSGLTVRLHAGTQNQLPDPIISAIEGEGNAPAYRGTAYVVFEHLDLTQFGSRIPQFNFEVFRRPPELPGVPRPPALDIRGVALVPGTGEYALATEPVRFDRGKGDSQILNVHNDLGVADLRASIDQMLADLPNAQSVSLVVSWFGDDLRCGNCQLQPAVEQTLEDGAPMRWEVSGVGRGQARTVSMVDGRPVFGGTPADASVIQAIRYLKAQGLSVMFYPFILMDVPVGNGLDDPWGNGSEQPPVPWRGRITLFKAPGVGGSSDQTSAAASEVERFFGQAQPSDFDVDGNTVRFSGELEWSYRRFILHYAHICSLAGGVDAFCIGSEMRGLSQIRDGTASYPAVREFCSLATDVRSILGSETKIGYAADWSEYFGHQPADGSNDLNFHLDSLWAHEAIDFVGIDNYMPLSDWRDGSNHRDAAAGSIYDIEYLRGNIAGGEGFDWYYADMDGRERQNRLPIGDGLYGEDWVFRYKDLVSWWSKPHYNRQGGVRFSGATEWQPKSKPIWFTELGCPAVDKGTNQPNVFHDPKSSESFFPYFSNGSRDDFIQYRYLQAMFGYWGDDANNPVSDVYEGRMIDLSRAHVWAWDARPWPDFPDRIETWIDGENYARGHWLNGRANLLALAEVVAELCLRSGFESFNTEDLYGGLTGFLIEAVESARQSLQPLMLTYGFDSFSLEGFLVFQNRNARVIKEVQAGDCVAVGEDPAISLVRAPHSEAAGRVTLGFVRGDLDYRAGAVEAAFPDTAEPLVSQSSVPLVLWDAEAEVVAGRWLNEGWIARDTASFALPPSDLAVSVGDVIELAGRAGMDRYRVDRIDEMGHRSITAVRIEPSIYDAPIHRPRATKAPVLDAPTPAFAEFLDLPLLNGDEVPFSPYVAIAKRPWSGPVSVYASNQDFGYTLNREITRPATMGRTLSDLPEGIPGRWMASSLLVHLQYGVLQSRSSLDVLNGANVAALRSTEDEDWEVFQFQTAELVEPRTYRLTGLLRGQAGTDGVMPTVWPSGTDFVLIDGSVVQLDTPAAARGLLRHYRIGPATRGYDDPSYLHETRAFEGVGLRPYRPVHFRAVRDKSGDVLLSWICRTRVDGDSWQGAEVPLGEERERYSLRIWATDVLLRELTVTEPNAVYTALHQATDGSPATLIFDVAQISDRFGPGPYERIFFNG